MTDIHVLWHAPADAEAVAEVLARPVDQDGRGEWQWFRAPNGDLILGLFPMGDTYMEFTDEADTAIANAGSTVDAQIDLTSGEWD